MLSLSLTSDTDTDTNATAPEGFDPRQFPVIGQHFFGIKPPRPWQHISTPLARVIGRLRVVDNTEDEAA